MDKLQPVAWIDEINTFVLDKDYKQFPKSLQNGMMPLYTHPAKCGKCNDTEWVCENHPDQEAHKCRHCEGAGKPCECTHPAKTLTDAEIRTIQDMCHLKNVGYNTFIMRFARAILRKAQEK